MSWDSLDVLSGDDTVYDIIGAPLTSVQVSGDYSAVTCVANDLDDSPFVDPDPEPGIGEAVGWLVRGYNLCNAASGTYGDGTPVPDPRDDLDLNTFGCTTCGNGVVEGAEPCDGADLAGESCQTQGFAYGTLGCTVSCVLDTSGCGTHLASVPNGNLIAVNEVSASAVLVSNIGLNSFSGLALAANGSLFGSRGANGNGEILLIDAGTGGTTLVGASGFLSVPALDFGPASTPFEGVLYGVVRTIGTGGQDFLITIDTATGIGTPIGSAFGVPFVDGIVFADNGRLFGLGFVGSATSLIEIDPLTGVDTIIGPTGFTAVAGIEVTGSGGLIGSLGGIDPMPGSLISIDPGTGAGTLIGSTGFSPVSGLTELP